MPLLAQLQVCDNDNSEQVHVRRAFPDPSLVIERRNGRLVWPVPNDAALCTPRWATPVLEAAFAL